MHVTETSKYSAKYLEKYTEKQANPQVERKISDRSKGFVTEHFLYEFTGQCNCQVVFEAIKNE